MNKNAERIRNAVLTYKGERDAASEKIKAIRKTYGEEAGEAEARIQGKRLAQARAAAEKEIRLAHSEGRNAASSWGILDGNKLTEDTKLLDAGLVDIEAFNGMKERYKENSTMLSVLKKYGEKKNAEAISSGTGVPGFETRDIPTKETKMKAWDNVQAQALDALDAMDGTGKYQGKNDDWGASLAVDHEILEHMGENL